MNRIPLQIVDGRVVLTAVVECKALRVPRQIMRFVVDTGSRDSYLSDKDVKKLQIPIKGKGVEGEVDFGGSRFRQIALPKFTVYMLDGDNAQQPISRSISLSALKTTKVSMKKIQVAQTLPSILGLDFLEEQKLSLHVILTEKLAFLQLE